MLRPSLFACLVMLGMDAPAAPAQVADEPVGVDPSVPIDEARAAYRGGVIVESLRITLRSGAGPPRVDTLVLRMDAAGIAPGDPPRRIAIEAGGLRLYADAGHVVATHAAEPGTYWQNQGEQFAPAHGLLDLLPPLPVPQLALAFPGDNGWRTPTPYTTDAAWASALLDPSRSPPSFDLRGRCAEGTVTATFDARTHRLLAFVADLSTGAQAARLEIRCRELPAEDPASWEPDLTGRVRVPTLAGLRPDHPVAELARGTLVPDMVFQHADLSAWSLAEAIRSATEADPAGLPAAVLVLFRSSADPERSASIEADARAGLDAARAVAAEPGDPSRAPCFIRAAVVVPLSSFDRGWFDSLAARLARADSGDHADRLLWSSSSANTIDRFSRRTDALIAVVWHDRALSAVIPLDGRAGEAGAVADELRRSLNRAR